PGNERAAPPGRTRDRPKARRGGHPRRARGRRLPALQRTARPDGRRERARRAGNGGGAAQRAPATGADQAAWLDRPGNGGGARFPGPAALGLPREVPPEDFGEGRRGAWARRLTRRRRGQGPSRGVAGRVRPGARGRDPRLPDDEPGVGRPIHEDRGPRHGRGRRRGASGGGGSRVRDPCGCVNVGRDAADQERQPRPCQRRERRRRGARLTRGGEQVSARVTRIVLREQVKELILERILNGSYLPGERLVETRIAAELGTSQAPV